MGGYAWVTLATNDSYSLGALVLAHSLKQAGTTQQLAVLITPGVTDAMREKLSSVFNVVQEVNILDSRDEANLRLLKRPELGITFTKLHCWRLTQFDKCVFLDADTLVLQNCDELFEREELSAAPDVGWPDCFNSGVFVYRPSNDTYESLIQFALDKGSFDGGDQGLLNLYFSDWAHKDISKHLPFIYNMCSTACYSYLPAFKQFGGNAKIIHFIGPAKPWLQYFDSESRIVNPSGGLQHLQHVLQKWWDLFCQFIHPVLSKDMVPRTHSTANSSSTNVPSHSSYIPENPEIHDFSSPIDYQKNIWDPWEEYDNRQAGNAPVHVQNQQLVIDHICQSISNQDTNSQQTKDQNVHIVQDNNQIHHSFRVENQNISVDETHFTESHNTNANSTDADHSSHHSNQCCDNSVTSQILVNIDDNLNKQNVHSVSPVDISNSPPPLTEIPTEPPQTTQTSPPSNLSTQIETTTTVSNDTSTNEDESDTGLAGAYAQLTLGVARTPEQAALDDHLRRQGWEVGNIDYLGRDSFDNIWNKICQTLGETKIEPVAPVKEVKKTPVTPTKEAPAPVLPAAKPKAPDASPSSDVTATPPDEAVTEQQQQEIQPTTTEIKLTEQPIPTTQIQPPTPTTPVDVPQTNVELTESVPVTTPTEPSSVAIAESVQLTESVPVPTPTESSSVESVQLTESVPVPTPTEPSVAESVQLTESVPVPTPAEPSSVQLTDKSDASSTEPLVVKEIDVSPSEAIVETKPDAPPAESVAESVTEPKAEDASAALAEPVCPIVAKAPEASLAPIEIPIVPETPVESPAQAQPKKEEPKAQVPSTPPVVAAAPSIPSTPPAEAKPKAESTPAPTAAPSTAPAAEAATPAPTPPPRKPAAPKKILKPKK